MEGFGQSLVLLLHLRAHGKPDGNFLVFGQVLPHIHQGEKDRVFQEKTGIDQRGDPRQHPFSFFRAGSPAVGIVFRVLDLKGAFHHTILIAKMLGSSIRLAVRHHLRRGQPEQEVEDAGGVAVDEGGGHAHHLFRRPRDLCHSVPLAAVLGVLVKLIRQQAVDLPLHLPFDEGADGEPPAAVGGGIEPFRVLGKVLQRLQHLWRFCFVPVEPEKVPVDKTKAADFRPLTGMSG